ncbi:MAG: hypothetical protein QF752_17190 [Planctomycetota bacterium]|jgi:hypothetical protein|nr:hypothetical protein [Planctomycetota bacterium]
MNTSKINLTALLSTILFNFLLIAGVASACPASYVKQKAEDNQGTALYDKSAKIADKYMTNRGVNPQSPAGEVTRPYVIGTTLVEHDHGKVIKRTPHWVAEERIDLENETVDEIANKALGPYANQSGEANSDTGGHHFFIPCYDHFNRHFGNGLEEAGDLDTQLETEPQAG